MNYFIKKLFDNKWRLNSSKVVESIVLLDIMIFTWKVILICINGTILTIVTNKLMCKDVSELSKN